jgi:hypothetical protein
MRERSGTPARTILLHTESQRRTQKRSAPDRPSGKPTRRTAGRLHAPADYAERTNRGSPGGRDHTVGATSATVANRSRRRRRAGHRFRGARPLSASQNRASTGILLHTRIGGQPAGAHARRRRDAHLWRISGLCQSRPRDLSACESGAGDPSRPDAVARTRCRATAGVSD